MQRRFGPAWCGEGKRNLVQLSLGFSHQSIWTSCLFISTICVTTGKKVQRKYSLHPATENKVSPREQQNDGIWAHYCLPLADYTVFQILSQFD